MRNDNCRVLSREHQVIKPSLQLWEGVPVLGNLEPVDVVSHLASMALKTKGEIPPSSPRASSGGNAPPAAASPAVLFPATFKLIKSQKLLVPPRKTQKMLEVTLEMTWSNCWHLHSSVPPSSPSLASDKIEAFS